MAGISKRETTIRMTSPGFAGVTIQRPSGMTCARREAGTPRLAIFTPSRSPSPGRTPPRDRSRPDPRGGRARLGLLLPVLALLLGAISLFAAAPAQAQSSEVWSATLRVNTFGNGAGCDPGIATCADRLSPNSFVYKGTTYTIQGLLHFYTGQLRFRLSGNSATQTKAALGPLTLIVSWGSGPTTRTLKVKNAGSAGNYITWSMSDPSWSEGQQVSMKLVSPPTKPTGLSAQASDRQITLRWNNPNDPTITKYQIYVIEDGAAGSWSDISGSSAATTSHTVNNLTNGTTYQFRIRAVNAAGNSPQSNEARVKPSPSADNTLSGLSATSATSASGPFSALPLTPSTFSATTTSYTATVPHATTYVKLTPVANENNAVVEIRKGSANVLTDLSGTTAAIALDVGANAITVQVRAQDSSTKDYTVTITRQVQPPQSLTVTPGDQKLVVSWTAPSGAVTDYVVQYTSSSTVANGAPSGSDPATAWVVAGRPTLPTTEITGLTNGTEYRVRVRARHAGSRSAFAHGKGTPTATAPPPPPPPARAKPVKPVGPSPAVLQPPQNLQVTPGDRKLVLSWTAPSGAVTGYDVHYTSADATTVANDDAASGSDPSTAWVVVDRAGSGTSQEITGLDNGRSYRVRVRTRNAAAGSPWLHGTGTPAGLQPPQDLTVTPGDQKLVLSWTAPSGAVTGYDV
ncbi:MAG: fibronectin type III domain-containing protein, partial [Paracoccaceae bacterium]|nr:fibronectin type III domain-containing protein [Paracoccaceae bacterium]